jgi:hypothetical protein
MSFVSIKNETYGLAGVGIKKARLIYSSRRPLLTYSLLQKSFTLKYSVVLKATLASKPANKGVQWSHSLRTRAPNGVAKIYRFVLTSQESLNVSSTKCKRDSVRTPQESLNVSTAK